jgi:hypothetical protein
MRTRKICLATNTTVYRLYILNEEWDGRHMWHVWRTGEVHTGFWCGDVTKSDHLENPGVVRRKILQLILKKENGDGAWTGMIWLSS